MERVFLNIPLKLVKKSKRDKNLLEQIAFAVMVKSKYCSSKIKKVSVNKVAEICHVSKQKAKKLLSDAKANNNLFVFDERSGDLTVKSFKRYRNIYTDKKGRKIYDMYVFKYKFNKYNNEGELIEDKLRDVVRFLRESLMLNAVNGFERNPDRFHHCKDKISLCGGEGLYLTQKHISNIVGMKRTAAIYLVKKLEKKGHLGINHGGVITGIPLVDMPMEDVIETFNDKYWRIFDNDNTIYTFMPNSYYIKSRDINERFKHIIYGHAKRLSSESKVESYLFSADYR